MYLTTQSPSPEMSRTIFVYNQIVDVQISLNEMTLVKSPSSWVVKCCFSVATRSLESRKLLSRKFRRVSSFFRVASRRRLFPPREKCPFSLSRVDLAPYVNQYESTEVATPLPRIVAADHTPQNKPFNGNVSFAPTKERIEADDVSLSSGRRMYSTN